MSFLLLGPAFIAGVIQIAVTGKMPSAFMLVSVFAMTVIIAGALAAVVSPATEPEKEND